MERRDASELSLLEFHTTYASAHVPVVVTGLVEHMTKVCWTLDYIKSVRMRVSPLVIHIHGQHGQEVSGVWPGGPSVLH